MGEKHHRLPRSLTALDGAGAAMRIREAAEDLLPSQRRRSKRGPDSTKRPLL